MDSFIQVARAVIFQLCSGFLFNSCVGIENCCMLNIIIFVIQWMFLSLLVETISYCIRM